MAKLKANISVKQHGRDNPETTLETTKGQLHRTKISRTCHMVGVNHGNKLLENIFGSSTPQKIGVQKPPILMT